MMSSDIILGLEACVSQRPARLESARFGLLMNRASVDRDLRLSCDVLGDAYPGQLAALFTPQHGLWGEAQANMVESEHGWHSRLDIPVHSLYSESRRPTPEMLAGLDCLLIDLQDVGTRVYTFVWTMLESLRACADAGIPVLVLDRPNPIGGRIVEGPLLEDEFRSFVGGAPIPMRHGLTLGELARLLAIELGIDIELEVIAMQGWTPERRFASLCRHWLFPSPNLPRVESTLVYPGQVLLEGTNVSEGRGTTTPFEVIGAPFIETERMMERAAELDLPGVKFLPTCFRPTFDKWQGEVCGGLSIHVTDADQFRAVKTTIALLSIVMQQCREDFQWLDPPYEYEWDKPPIDIIFGSSRLRETLAAGDAISTLKEMDVVKWNERTGAIQLYRSPGDRFHG